MFKKDMHRNSGRDAGYVRANRRPMGVSACLCILLLAVMAACNEGGLPGKTDTSLQPPPRFEQLEPAIQDQFNELRNRLARAGNDSANTTTNPPGPLWGELGQWFHVYRYPDSARRSYREASRLDPEEPRWPYYLGMLAAEAGDLEQAVARFEAAAERSPNSAAALIRLAEVHLALRQPERAEASYRRALALKPGSIAAGVGMARLNLQRQNARQAIEILQPLLSADPRTAGHINYLLAQAHRSLGHDEQAREHLENLPDGASEPPPMGGDDPWLDELVSKNISSNHLTRMGLRAYRQGNFRLAAAHSGKAAQLNPDNPELRTNYAAALLALGRPDKALEQIEAALEQDSDLARAHLIKASSHLKTGERTAARDTLLHALELDPGMEEARRQLGQIYQQFGQPELAIEQYAELRRRSGEVQQVRFWHAALLASTGRHEDALASLAQDREVLPRSSLLRLLEIRVLAAAKKEATRNPARAAELLALVEPDVVDVYYAETAAMVAAAIGNRDLAVGWQLHAVEALETVSNTAATHIARRRLVLYKENKACHTPWEPGEALITKSVRTLDAMTPSS